MVLGQAVGFVTQIVVASLFGARADMDAFLAANTLPQYVIAVLLNALGFVFIPIFVDYATAGREEEAWQIASGVINLCLLVLGILTVVGIVFAEPLLRLTTPGLPSQSLHLAAQVALITWPTILLTGVLSLLTGIYQAQGRFGWPAAVPFIGASVSLGLVVILARLWGVVGMALATSMGVALQTVLLLRIALRPGRYRLAFHWQHPGVRQVIHLLTPLLLSSLLIRWTPIIERYLASGLPEGSISHLGYAFKLLSLMIALISTGIATVVFPRMALNMAAGDLGGLKHTTSLGLRVMWLAVAPAIVLGGVLALPLVVVFLKRGQFNAGDASAVAGLLRVYLLALIGACLGNVTGRTFYALKDTRTLAVIGVIEALAYAVYSVFLVRQWGLVGLAWGYVLYFDISLLWQIFLIRRRVGNRGGRTLLVSFARTSLAAILGGGVVWGIIQTTPNLWLQLFGGGALGLLVYGAALMGLRSAEAQTIWAMSFEHLKQLRSGISAVAP
jgi:putative peptidoglycan lipid II flippase